MAYGSTDSRQLHNFIAGQTQYYPMFVPGAKTFFVAPSSYTAAGRNAIVANDGNDGESPQSPLSTIAEALDKCVSGRGDTIVLLPGTYTLTAKLDFTSKVGVRLVAAKPRSATITGDGVLTTLISVDSNDVEFAGLRIAGVAALTLFVDLANTSSIRNFHMHHCDIIGLESVASVTGILNGENIAGNDALNTIIEDCYFEGVSAEFIKTFGGGAIIRRNVFNLDDTASHTAIEIGDQGAAFGTVKGCYIYHNVFNGQTDAATLLAITWAGNEAQSQMVAVWENAFLSTGGASASMTQDRHPESIGINYAGTNTAATAVDPTA